MVVPSNDTSLDFYPLICNLTGVDSSVVAPSSPLGMLMMTAGIFLVLYGLIFLFQIILRFIMYAMSLGRYRD